ncbi:hypothetical protein [Oleiharenicola lentus]|uniref:hypothetical protein n=1 Tax=Oleiharenicola lentus TaxID=2508720 RepID=UPI003F680E8A
MNTAVSALRFPFADWLAPVETARPSSRQLLNTFSAYGYRFTPEGEELVHRDNGFEARIAFSPGRDRRTVVTLALVVPENRLPAGASGLLDEMMMEGLPVIGMGYGRGSATWEFRWNHLAGYSWRESSNRCVELIDRLRAVLN